MREREKKEFKITFLYSSRSPSLHCIYTQLSFLIFSLGELDLLSLHKSKTKRGPTWCSRGLQFCRAWIVQRGRKTRRLYISLCVYLGWCLQLRHQETKLVR